MPLPIGGAGGQVEAGRVADLDVRPARRDSHPHGVRSGLDLVRLGEHPDDVTLGGGVHADRGSRGHGFEQQGLDAARAVARHSPFGVTQQQGHRG